MTNGTNAIQPLKKWEAEDALEAAIALEIRIFKKVQDKSDGSGSS